MAAEPSPSVLTRGHRATAVPPFLQGVMVQQGSPCTHSPRGSSVPGLGPALSQTTKSGSTKDSLSKMQLLEHSGVFYTRSQALSKGISGNAQKISIQGATGAEQSCKGQERIQCFSCQTRGGSAWEQSPGLLQIQTSGASRGVETSWSTTSPFSCAPEAEFS